MNKILKKNTFLIVDSEIGSRSPLRRMLSLIGVNRTVEAGDGQQALKLLREHDIDFIICEWQITGISGIEFLEVLRTIQDYRYTPFLMISSNLSAERVTQAAEAEVDGFLGKPFVPKSLENKIREILATKTDPDPETLAFEHLGLLRDEKKYDLALDYLDRIRDKFPKSAKLFTAKGELLERRANAPGDKKEDERRHDRKMAELAYLKALELNPDFVRAHNSLGNFYEKTGQPHKALEQLENATRISPNNSVRISKIGKISLENGDPQKAAKAFDRLMEIQSTKRAESLQAMGDQFLKHGYLDKALEIFSSSRDEVADPVVFNKIAIVLRKQGKFQDAIDTYLKAIQISPDDENLHFNLGRAYVEYGAGELARNSFLTALSLDPEFEEAKKELKKTQ